MIAARFLACSVLFAASLAAHGQIIRPELKPLIDAWGRTDRDKEIELGHEVYDAMKQRSLLSHNEAYQRRVDRILAQLVEALPDRPYSFQAVVVAKDPANPDVVNANCLPGGYVTVYEGLLEWMRDDNELAFTLAHEIGHAYRRHGVRFQTKMESDIAIAVFVAILTKHPIDGFSLQMRALEHSRADEREADEFGTELYLRAGFDPAKVTNAMQSLIDWDKHEGQREPPDWLSSHPNTPSRIADIRATCDRLLKAGLKPVDTGPLPDLSIESIFGKIPTLATEPCEWQPSEPGMLWSYEVRSAGPTTRYSIQTVGKAEVGGTSVSRMRMNVGGSTVFYQEIADKDRVWRRNRLEDPKSPWSVETAFPDEGGIVAIDRWGFRYVGKEKVDTPAGSFPDCLKMTAVESTGRTLTLWFAPNVGLVRRLNEKSGVDEVLVSFKKP